MRKTVAVYRRAGKGSKESDPESDEKKMDDKEHDQPQVNIYI